MKYGFIGCGNMGSAIANAIGNTSKDIFITDRSGKAKAFADAHSFSYTNSEAIARDCDAVFLAVKPQMMKKAIEPIAPILAQKKPLLITMAAGLSISSIEEMVGVPLPVIRIMPNTPVAVGMGMTIYCCNECVTENQKERFLSDMSYSGRMDAVDEALIDAAGVVSGCGPAYIYIFAEALADGAVACGVPRSKALQYAAATLMGAGQMLLQTGEHPGALKDAVCSPGGSTIAGVNVLEQNGFRGAVIDCVKASFARNKELGK